METVWQRSGGEEVKPPQPMAGETYWHRAELSIDEDNAQQEGAGCNTNNDLTADLRAENNLFRSDYVEVAIEI